MPYKVNPFYNIDSPVGKGQPNLPMDVKLVQYLLIKVASRTQGKWTPPAAEIVADGVYTPALSEWILSYQTVVKAVRDGVVSPQVNPHWKHHGTIISLNASFRNNFGAARHDNIVGEPDIPADLRSILGAGNAKPDMGTTA
ncbi:hypothetical protein [Terrarubrum flagellatum]|uniref:hypothetical protein n=1 Tax=Terrirubrum flagellatum TaxID=2895980 RepID=UPI0031451927